MGKDRQRLRPPAAKGGQHIQAPDTKSQGSTNHEHPVFCLRYLGNLSDCDEEHRAALADTMCTLAQLTWQQISASGRQKLGFENIPVRQLQVKVPEIAAREEHVLAFRFHGKAPMLGLRDGPVFRVLHLDWNFSAYDHG